ncbi:MAG: copper chaperone PCu(A)C [Rhodospirillaceae bacterium]
MIRLFTAAVTVASVLLAGAAFAHEYKVGAIEVAHPMTRATAASPNGAVFLIVHNEGKEGDRLVSASTPVAEKAELHTHLMDDSGVMKMRRVDAIDIEAGATVRLAPGGLHVMLFGIKEPLKADTTVPLTLTFQKAGAVTVDVLVRAPGESVTGHDH